MAWLCETKDLVMFTWHKAETERMFVEGVKQTMARKESLAHGKPQARWRNLPDSTYII